MPSPFVKGHPGGPGRPRVDGGLNAVVVPVAVPAYLRVWIKAAAAMMGESKADVIRDALRSYLLPVLLMGTNVPQRLLPGAPIFAISEAGAIDLVRLATGDERCWTTGTVEVPEAVSRDMKGLVVDIVKEGVGYVVGHESVAWRTGVRLPFTPGDSIHLAGLVPRRIRPYAGAALNRESMLDGWPQHMDPQQLRRYKEAGRKRRYRRAAKKKAEYLAKKNARTPERQLMSERSKASLEETLRPPPTDPEGSDTPQDGGTEGS